MKFKSLILLVLMAVAGFPATAADKEVTIAYQLIFNPWKVAIAQKQFEKETGYKIRWRNLDTPAKVLSGLASGQVDIALLGSTGIATVASRGIDIDLIYIAENIEEAEALVVRNGSGIKEGKDLKGKKLAVPFVSTTHFHTLVALEYYGLTDKDVRLLNMPPNGIAAAWLRGDIDAAFVWNPALARIKGSGSVLVTSGELGRWKTPTFDGIVVRGAFADDHPDFMKTFVRILAETDEAYRSNPWQKGSPEVQAIAKLMGGNPDDVPEALAAYEFPTLADQASCRWLGCGEGSGAAKALKETALFLKDQKKIPKLPDSFADIVDPRWVEAVMKEQ